MEKFFVSKGKSFIGSASVISRAWSKESKFLYCLAQADAKQFSFTGDERNSRGTFISLGKWVFDFFLISFETEIYS